MKMTTHEQFMSIALDLASRGRGAVEPNPVVGAVIVRDGRVIGRGWHKKFGEAHAEVNALADAGHDVAGSDIYVTLEPCSHYGKTPPCADALISAGIKRVFISVTDPDENVSGRGIEKLRSAGIEVVTGVCESAGRELLKEYLKSRTLRRPWVICKWAQTLDGCIDLRRSGQQRWISCEESRRDVHILRSCCDGILVGVETVLKDDPMLTNRSILGRQPVRVVLDGSLRIPTDCKLVKTAKEFPLLVVTSEDFADFDKPEKLFSAGAEVISMPVNDGHIDLPALLDEMGRRKWTRLLVEGGAAVHASFINSRLADEVQVYIAPLNAPPIPGLPRFPAADLPECYQFRTEQQIGVDTFRTYRLVNDSESVN